jgi:phosphoglycolate phosphatase-like HAD superfamily hydrolase
LIEAVIFDLDGTLINLPLNYDELTEEFSRIAPTSNFHPLVPAIAKLDETTKERVFEAWDRAELATAGEITLVGEGKAIYDEFAAKPKALVTLQGRALVDTILESLGLSFDCVATREDSLNRATQLKFAAQKLRRSTGSILFVGNTPNDRQAARQVGCQYREVKT